MAWTISRDGQKGPALATYGTFYCGEYRTRLNDSAFYLISEGESSTTAELSARHFRSRRRDHRTCRRVARRSAKDKAHNQAIVLKELLDRKMTNVSANLGDLQGLAAV